MTALESAAIARAVLDTESIWASIPLVSAVVCAEPTCGTVWDARHRRCPKCAGSEAFQLAHLLGSERARRVLALSAAIEELRDSYGTSDQARFYRAVDALLALCPEQVQVAA